MAWVATPGLCGGGNCPTPTFSCIFDWVMGIIGSAGPRPVATVAQRKADISSTFVQRRCNDAGDVADSELRTFFFFSEFGPSPPLACGKTYDLLRSAEATSQ